MNGATRGRGLILAAPASGSGKTLVTAGLLRHLRDRGVRVAAAKVGPDYIDPTFHAMAAGGVCLNLDIWAMRPAALAGLIGHLESAADLILCEGVMGLFDGAGPNGEIGSTARLARLTGWPVVLIVDAAGQGVSVAALVEGFARHDPDVPLAGVIFNRVGSSRHASVLAMALRHYLPDLPMLGRVFQQEMLSLPARHLGLVPAGERSETRRQIDRAGWSIGDGVDVDRLIGLARPSQCSMEAAGPGPAPLGQRIAVARDDAFLFTYEATLATWRLMGAEIRLFSPLADDVPASDCDAIYLPGGYPELHTDRLAAARRFRSAMRKAADAGTPIYGECGGYMVLGEILIDADRHAHRMLGLLPLRTSFAVPQRHLGYREATLLDEGPLGPAGARFRGHEFHHTKIIREHDAGALFTLRDAMGRELGSAGLRRGSVAGSFIHLIDRADG